MNVDPDPTPGDERLDRELRAEREIGRLRIEENVGRRERRECIRAFAAVVGVRGESRSRPTLYGTGLPSLPSSMRWLGALCPK